MEAATTGQEENVSEQNETAVETSPAEAQAPQELFRYSEYVHVGPEAGSCEEGENGACANPLHFHAWCRIPNQFQNNSIREKALAAKARRARQLRDQSTDAYEILEAELDLLRRDGTPEPVIEELLSANFWRDHLAAVTEVKEDEKFATIDEDLERFRVLTLTADEERPADEYEELERHIDAFEEAVKERRDEEQRPQREGLAGLELDALIDQVRDARIDTESNEAFMRDFTLWQMYIGTLKPRDPAKGRPVDRSFGDVNHLTAAAPEVIDALRTTFESLELAKRSSAGN